MGEDRHDDREQPRAGLRLGSLFVFLRTHGVPHHESYPAGNGVKRERWTAEVVDFLHSIFEPCPPPPEAAWELSDEYLSYQARKEAEAEARRQADLARRQGKPQPALEALWDEDVPEPAGAG